MVKITLMEPGKTGCFSCGKVLLYWRTLWSLLF